MSSVQPPSQHIIIIGAGITGLLIAQGLHKAGVSYAIYEQQESASQRRRDWGMGIHWSLPFLKACLPPNLFAKIKTAQVDPFFDSPPADVVPILNGETGETLKDIPIPLCHRVSRRKFRDLCSTNISIAYKKTVTKVDFPSTGVVVHFSDGSTARGTAVVGADGARSVIRQCILGERGATSAIPYTATMVSVKYLDASQARRVRSVHPINSMAVHPEGIWGWISILDVEDDSDPCSWTFQLMSSWPGNEEPTLTMLKEKSSKFISPFGDANQWIPEGTPVYANKLSFWQPVEWDNHGGRVTLAGDAAHPMTNHRGQGLNHAIADVANFLKAVAANGGEEAVTAYDKEVISRGGQEVQLSKLNTEMLHDWDRLMESPLMKISANKSS